MKSKKALYSLKDKKAVLVVGKKNNIIQTNILELIISNILCYAKLWEYVRNIWFNMSEVQIYKFYKRF